MVKKVVKKKKTTSKKKTSKKKTTKRRVQKVPSISEGDTKLGKILIENFIGLQKVMVNLSVKFDDLSNKISKLLELFEISAKALAEKDLIIQQTARDDSKIIKEIGNLSEQNKIIARGLTLMHERLSGGPEEEEEPIETSFRIPIPSQMKEKPTSPMTKPNPAMVKPGQFPFPNPQKNSPPQQPMKSPFVQQKKKEIPNTTPNNSNEMSTTNEITNKSPGAGYEKSIASEEVMRENPE